MTIAKPKGVLLLAGLSALILGVAQDKAASAKSRKSIVIHLEMSDTTSSGVPEGSGTMAAKLDRESVPSGPVTIVAKNSSAATQHEMILAKIARSGSLLPMKSAEDEVDEGKINSLGELENIAPGASKSLIRNLSPGHYVLLCNRPGHYHAGMWTVLTVTATAAQASR